MVNERNDFNKSKNFYSLWYQDRNYLLGGRERGLPISEGCNSFSNTRILAFNASGAT